MDDCVRIEIIGGGERKKWRRTEVHPATNDFSLHPELHCGCSSFRRIATVVNSPLERLHRKFDQQATLFPNRIRNSSILLSRNVMINVNVPPPSISFSRFSFQRRRELSNEEEERLERIESLERMGEKVVVCVYVCVCRSARLKQKIFFQPC